MSFKKILIFANGDAGDGAMVRRALEQAAGAFVLAADGGARLAQDYGYAVNHVIGDMDSLTDDELNALEAAGATIQRFPAEKNQTDLELALMWAAENGYDWVRVVGALGGRLDQMMGNLYLLALPQLQDLDVRIVAGKQEIWLLTPDAPATLTGVKGDTVSLIPMGGAAVGVTTENLYYPLHDETLAFGPARGISNVMDAETAQVTLREGILLIVKTMGRA